MGHGATELARPTTTTNGIPPRKEAAGAAMAANGRPKATSRAIHSPTYPGPARLAIGLHTT